MYAQTAEISVTPTCGAGCNGTEEIVLRVPGGDAALRALSGAPAQRPDSCRETPLPVHRLKANEARAWR